MVSSAGRGIHVGAVFDRQCRRTTLNPKPRRRTRLGGGGCAAHLRRWRAAAAAAAAAAPRELKKGESKASYAMVRGLRTPRAPALKDHALLYLLF